VRYEAKLTFSSSIAIEIKSVSADPTESASSSFSLISYFLAPGDLSLFVVSTIYMTNCVCASRVPEAGLEESERELGRDVSF
jgi:hypothetical protein